MAAETKIEIPAAQAGLPEAVEKKWEDAYAAAFREAQRDNPEQPSAWGQHALREANRVLRFDDPQNYEEALKLEDWQFALREHRHLLRTGQKVAEGSPAAAKLKPDDISGRVLVVVTRDGKKFTFQAATTAPAKIETPAATQEPAEKQKPEEANKNGAGAPKRK